LYSRTSIKEEQAYKVEVDGQLYILTVDWQYQVEADSPEYFTFLKSGFLSMMKSIKFEQIGRNCFEPAKAVLFPQYKIEMWPGFDIRLNLKEAGVFLNIEPCHKVVRIETAYEVMKGIIDNCESRNMDF